jgi:hypothetical protein
MFHYRKLVTGVRVREAEKLHSWEFTSKCPAKWIHIDCENGHVYVARVPKGWEKPTRKLLDAAIKILKQRRQK